MAGVLTGRWGLATATMLGAARRLDAAAQRALLQEAHYLRRKIVQGITKQAPGGLPFVPLEASTLRKRRAEGFSGTKALIVTGDLRNSIKVTRVDKETVFVGVLRSVEHGGGELAVNIAAIHEFGTSDIPARPFLRPTFEAERENIRKRFALNVARNLGGVFGRIGV